MTEKPKRKTQHQILREMFAKEGTSFSIDYIAERLGTTPVSACAAMATLRNPKKQKEPFVITRVPRTQDYCRGTPAAPKVKKKVAAKRPAPKKKARAKGGSGSANGSVVAAAA